MTSRELLTSLIDAIASGAMAPGSRLLPQREFAYQNGIAYSTAARIYTELTRRGLIAGEVGRGTFVRDPALPPTSLLEPSIEQIDLEYSFPSVASQRSAIAETLQAAFSTEYPAAQPVAIGRLGPLQEASADYLARGNWHPRGADISFAGNGRQAMAAAMAAILSPGDRIGVEPLTYPAVKGLAQRLAVELVPLPVDDEGVVPSEARRVVREKGLKALYLQPSFQNPTGTFMGRQRRFDIAQLIAELNIPTIEDAIYTFLCDEEPLAFAVPEHVVLIDSLSKRVAPGVGLGFLVGHRTMLPRLRQSLQTGPWMPSGLGIAFGEAWMKRPDSRMYDETKRQDAIERQTIARRVLSEFQLRGNPRAYHVLMDLPEPWRAEDFASAARNRGIAVSPAVNFAAQPGHSPTAIRIALSAPPIATLEAALSRLVAIIGEGPGACQVD